MDAHSNFGISEVTVAPSPAASGTSLTVLDGSVFPAVPFNATVYPTGVSPTQANAEIVRVTNIAGNVLTITRQQESTAARTILVGDLIANTATVKVFTDIEDALSNELSVRAAADTTLGNQVSAVSASLSTVASALSARIDTVSNAVSIVSAAVVVASALASTADAHANTVSNAVSVLSTQLSLQVSALSQVHSALSADVVSVRDRLSALSDAHTSLVDRVSANSATGGSGSVTSAEHVSGIDRISAVSSLVSTTASALSARIDTVSNAVSVLSTQLSLQVSALSQVHSVTSATLASVMSLLDGGTTGQVLKKQSNADFDFAWDTDLAGGSSSATVTSATLVSINNRISGVSAAVSVLSADVTSLKDRVSANSSLISTTASALSARIDTVSNAVSVLSTQLSLQVSALSQVHSALSAAHVSLVDRVSANSALLSTVASALSARIDTVSQQVSVLSATGHIISLQNVDASAVSAGCPVYAFTSANTYKKANAGNATTKRVIGLVLDGSVAISAVSRVQTGGPVTLTTAQWDAITGGTGGLTIGSPYYLDTTAGLLTLTPPATGALRPVGVGISTTVMQLMLADVDDLTSAVSTLSTNLSALSVQLSLVASALSQQISVLSTQLSLQISAISQAHSVLSAGHVSLVDRVSAISADVTSVKDRVSGISAAVSTLSADLTSVKDRVSANSSLISTTASALSARIDTVSNAVSVLSTQLSLQVSALSQVHSALSAAHVSLVDRVSANSALISTVASALSARIDTVSNAVSVLSTQLSLQISAISQAHSALSAAHVSLVDRVSANSATGGGGSVTSAEYLSLVNRVSANSAVGSGNGGFISATNGWSVAVSAGAPVYFASASANTFRLASAANTPAGLVFDGSVASAATGTIQTRDVLTLTTAQWDAITGASGGLTPGSLYYVGTTAGTMTTTLPTAAARAVGVAISTTEMQVRPMEVGDWLSDAISVGTATAADLSNKISAILGGLAPGGTIQMGIVAATNQVVGSAISNISGLSISLAAGAVYQLEARVIYNLSTVSAHGFGLSYPTLVKGAFKWAGHTSAAVASTLSTTGRFLGYTMESAAAANSNAIHFSLPNTGPSAGFTHFMLMEGMIEASAAGTLQMVHKQAVSVNATHILKGSFIRAYKLT